jgi:hypothetical protein
MAEVTGGAAAADLAARLESLPNLVNGNARLIKRGRFLTLELQIGLGSAPYHLVIERGRIAALERGPHLLRPWRFAIRAGEEVWRRFWQAVPAPQDHDIFAFFKRGELTIEGDLQPFMANLFYFKDVLAAPRQWGARR